MAPGGGSRRAALLAPRSHLELDRRRLRGGGATGLRRWLPRLDLGLHATILLIVLAAAIRVAAGNVGTLYLPVGYPTDTFFDWRSGEDVALGFGYLFPFSYLFHSIFRGEPAGNNPWMAKGLEWTTTSPPPTHNFDTIPVVTEEPYAYDQPSEETAVV